MRPVNVNKAWSTERMQIRDSGKSYVALVYDEHSVSFYFPMVTGQARQMAAALIAFSDIQDAKVAKGE